PFTATAPVDIILKHLHDAPVPPAEARPDLKIVPELQEVVLRCMAKDRDQRFQSMDELLGQLKAVRSRLTGATPQTSTPEPRANASGGAIAQTPPTPQPGLRTPSQPMSALRATPPRGMSRPPPPPRYGTRMATFSGGPRSICACPRGGSFRSRCGGTDTGRYRSAARWKASTRR